jgi:hypothetical protein
MPYAPDPFLKTRKQIPELFRLRLLEAAITRCQHRQANYSKIVSYV